MGVTKRRNGRFQARYTRNGKYITVGTFTTKKAAQEALAMARIGVTSQAIAVKYKPAIAQIIQTKQTPHEVIPYKKSFLRKLKNAYHSFRSNAKSKKQ